ncbi:MAG: glycosyltransferase [Burkholderiales bacterium]
MSHSIGVAIATYNGMEYLAQQLDSICAQTVKPDLISISDDCSTDGTAQYLQDFARRCEIPVVLNLNTQQTGVIRNFMLAFEQCHTDYVAYCDQDDVWRDGKIESYVRALDQPNVALVFHRSSIVDENLKSLGRFEPSNVGAGSYRFPHFPDYVWGFGHQMMFSKKAFEAMREFTRASSPPIATVGACFDFSLLVAAGMVGDIHFIDEELMMFRRHRGSVSPAVKTDPDQMLPERADARRDKVEEHATLIEDMLTQIGANRFAPMADAATESTYVRHLQVLHGRYQTRKTLYSADSWARRLQAFLQLVSARSYGSATINKLPMRQLLVDGWRSLKGGARQAAR